MFRQAFKNIDADLRNEAGCATGSKKELDGNGQGFLAKLKSKSFEFFCMPAKTGVAELAQKDMQQLELVNP